jgi:hypothetical protein
MTHIALINTAHNLSEPSAPRESRGAAVEVRCCRKYSCRPGQAKRDPGPITAGFRCGEKLEPQRATQRCPVVMGPGVRRDDSGGCRASLQR